MAKRRTKTQKERDKLNVSRLYLKGKTQTEIAEDLNLSQPTVSRALKDCREDWKASAVVAIDERKAQELAKIDTLELEYWNAWRRSQEDAETRQSKMVGQEVGDEKQPTKIERTVRTDEQVGDPRFLAGIQWCINKRCEILGIDAPTKIAQTDPSGEKEATGIFITIPSNGRERAPLDNGSEAERPENE